MKQKLKRREVLVQWALCNNCEEGRDNVDRQRLINRLSKRNWLRKVRLNRAERY